MINNNDLLFMQTVSDEFQQSILEYRAESERKDNCISHLEYFDENTVFLMTYAVCPTYF